MGGPSGVGYAVASHSCARKQASVSGQRKSASGAHGPWREINLTSTDIHIFGVIRICRMFQSLPSIKQKFNVVSFKRTKIGAYLALELSPI